MRLLSLSFAIAMISAAPALGGEVPFAAPPLPIQGQPAPVPALGDIMSKVQAQHIKLWYAIKYRDWSLMDYELEAIKDNYNNAVILYRNIPVEFISAADAPLAALQKAVKSKDGSKLERDFADLTAECNNCHKAGGVAFILINTPTSFPYSDQEVTPKEK